MEGAGRLHIYCGDGKGKTTAATGLAVRAAGSGMKVLFVRFLKNENSSELRILESVEQIELLHTRKPFGFYSRQEENVKSEIKAANEELWRTALEKAGSGKYGLLVLDEFMAADNYGMIPHDEAVQFLKHRPAGLEVVLTGRNPSDDIKEAADYISEIQKVKHPFELGVKARRGIEY